MRMIFLRSYGIKLMCETAKPPEGDFATFLFYRFRSPIRFYTAKTHNGHPPQVAYVRKLNNHFGTRPFIAFARAP